MYSGSASRSRALSHAVSRACLCLPVTYATKRGFVRRVLTRDDHRRRNVGLAENGCFDLTELDAVAAEFHLMIVSAEKLQSSVGRVAHQIAGLVQARSRIAREAIGNEAFAGELGRPW